MSYHFKKIVPELYNDLIPLFKSAFNANVDIQSINNKQDTAFAGAKDVGYIAYSEKNEPSGYYAVFPLNLKINSKIILSSQSGDTMVHKSHQRRGLFTQLADQTYNLCEQMGIKGVFGFPSNSSYPGFVNKLKWIHKENIVKYQFLIYTLPLSELSYRYNFLLPVYKYWFNLLKSLFKVGDYFEGSVASEGQNGVFRDKEYWQYKMRNRDISVIKISNSDTIIKLEGKLGIGDVNYSSFKQFKNVVFKLKLFCFFSGINRLVFYVSPKTKLDIDLSKLTTPQTGLPISYREFSENLNFESLKFVYFDMDTF